MDVQTPETVEKIISQDEVRLFRVRAVLAELTGVNVTFTNPVEVRAGARRIGWASLDEEVKAAIGFRLIADLVFDYASPERLEIEAGGRLYARLEGVHSFSGEPFEHVGLFSERIAGQLTAIDVLGLEISREPSYEGQPHLGEVLL